MATKRKSTKKVEEKVTPVEEEVIIPAEIPEEEAPVAEKPVKEEKSAKKDKKLAQKGPKYPIGSIVYLSKDASADLNGFKIFPQYKKDTYTVEAYDQNTGVYTLRQLKLLIRLQESFLVAPDARAHDALNRKQF